MNTEMLCYALAIYSRNTVILLNNINKNWLQWIYKDYNQWYRLQYGWSSVLYFYGLKSEKMSCVVLRSWLFFKLCYGDEMDCYCWKETCVIVLLIEPGKRPDFVLYILYWWWDELLLLKHLPTFEFIMRIRFYVSGLHFFLIFISDISYLQRMCFNI